MKFGFEHGVSGPENCKVPNNVQFSPSKFCFVEIERAFEIAHKNLEASRRFQKLPYGSTNLIRDIRRYQKVLEQIS